MPPSQPPQTQLNICHPTKWEMVYSDGWGLPEVCALGQGRGGCVQDLQEGPGFHPVYGGGG